MVDYLKKDKLVACQVYYSTPSKSCCSGRMRAETGSLDAYFSTDILINPAFSAQAPTLESY